MVLYIPDFPVSSNYMSESSMYTQHLLPKTFIEELERRITRL